MAAHKTNSLLKYPVTPIIVIILATVLLKKYYKENGQDNNPIQKYSTQKNTHPVSNISRIKEIIMNLKDQCEPMRGIQRSTELPN